MDSDDDDIVFEDSDMDGESSEPDYQVLSPSEIESQMIEIISDVQDILEVSQGVARILLHKYKWNKNIMMEKFYENPDTVAFLIDSQVIPEKVVGNGGQESSSNEPKSQSLFEKFRHTLFRQKSSTPTKSVSIPEALSHQIPVEEKHEEEECVICCDTAILSGLNCGHRACDQCWGYYLRDKIKDAQPEIQCMASDCKLIMEDEKILTYITDSETIKKYQQVILNSFVDMNSQITWCPGTNCGNAIKVEYPEPRLVICSCGTQFCFFCGNTSHKPASCRIMSLWNKKCQEMKDRNHTTDKGEGYGADRETFSWLMSNTKDCPKCLVSIEKNGGCNYMQCKNAKCRFQFCWVCMKAWSVHANAWYNCNKYDASADADRESARAALHRFLFYYTRYMAHQQSLELEGKLRRVVLEKAAQMELESRWIEVQYLPKSVDILSECRKTLMYTYAFAHYLKSDNNSEIFEANQKDLEMATEELSAILEREIDGDFDKLRQTVLDKCKYVEQRRQTLLDHCNEGDEQDFWEFIE